MTVLTVDDGADGGPEVSETLPVTSVTGSGAAARDAEFAAFVAEATPALARTAWLLCGDERRAEELVQQALVRTTSHGAPPASLAGCRSWESC